MSVILKYNSIRWTGGGVDINNAMDIRRAPTPAPAQEQGEAAEEAVPEVPEEPVISAEEILAEREAELIAERGELEKLRAELTMLREQYIEQGKEVILEAKRRAEGIVSAAESEADAIIEDAEKNRGDIFIKARAEGFEQGKKDGSQLVLKESQGLLEDVRDYSDSLNAGKAELFARYEKEIYETVMAIANKVTMNSMSVKDGTAAKKLIKAAAKDFRNSQLVRITLDENDASVELTADYEYLKQLCGGSAHVEIELIKDAEPGTVIIDNGEEITDAGIQTQLQMIRELGDGKFRGVTDDPPKKRGGRRKKAEEQPEEETDEFSSENDE